ncbi:hypothetical protein C8N35_11630 [Breoghania corrubedonensis]|uniref:Uncharacterized protein n=2 Tax=Breoghania corrubedonensis TaxID=665038 RepID=A0A2T5UPZ5_9HYPH|nr:hypothetical protein C8N35_11630 [Breoghania corrubedonensis]
MGTAATILTRAGVLLFDDEHIRWPLAELADWLDEGVKSIIKVKPGAHTEQIVLPLARGTSQKVPQDARVVQLIDILCNEPNEDGGGGRAIRSTARSSLDASEPSWHDPSYVPYRRQVRQYVYDSTLPFDFYVYPGNDGTGRVRAVASTLPPTVSGQVEAGSTNIAAYEIPHGLPEQYDDVLLDYVLYRANLKDDTAAQPARATLHYQAFSASLGYQAQTEAAAPSGGGR